MTKKLEAKYLVFLDVDGVFTSTRVQLSSGNPLDMWNVFDPVAISFMNKIHDTRDRVEFVLMSTWKEYLTCDSANQYQWVIATFRAAGFRGEFARLWKTNPNNDSKFYERGMTRAHEVKEYLELYAPNHLDYILFDDNDYDFEKVLGKRRLVRTDAENGLLIKHMRNALSIIGTWHEK